MYLCVCGVWTFHTSSWCRGGCVTMCLSVLQCVWVCYNVSECVTMCLSVLQCVWVCYNVSECVTMCLSVLQCGWVCYNVSECVTMCLSVLQCVWVCYILALVYNVSYCRHSTVVGLPVFKLLSIGTWFWFYQNVSCHFLTSKYLL